MTASVPFSSVLHDLVLYLELYACRVVSDTGFTSLAQTLSSLDFAVEG